MQDDESGIYAQPDVAGGTIPDSPQLYTEIEWREEFLGDVVFDKPPRILVSQYVAVCKTHTLQNPHAAKPTHFRFCTPVLQLPELLNSVHLTSRAKQPGMCIIFTVSAVDLVYAT